MGHMIGYNVYLDGYWIDKVFFNERCDGGASIDTDDVRKSLIDHDGYPSRIVVRREVRR